MNCLHDIDHFCKRHSCTYAFIYSKRLNLRLFFRLFKVTGHLLAVWLFCPDGYGQKQGTPNESLARTYKFSRLFGEPVSFTDCTKNLKTIMSELIRFSWASTALCPDVIDESEP